LEEKQSPLKEMQKRRILLKNNNPSDYKMRVLFIYPQYYNARGIPLGISLLSAILKEKGHETYLFDTTFMKTEKDIDSSSEEESEDYNSYQFIESPDLGEPADPVEDINRELINKIKEIKPGLIAFSVTTELWPRALDFMKVIKKNFDVPILIGGVHPTIDPEGVIEKAEMLCVGEGEEMIVEPCEKLEKKQDITPIKNLWIKKEGKVYKNPLRDLVVLDSLPCPDWSLFNRRHLVGIYRGKICNRGHYLAMRGCPFSCSYCTNNYIRKLFSGCGHYVRYESVDRTIENIKKLKEDYNLDMIKFSDDLFIARSMEDLEYFKERYKKEINLPFLISISPRLTTKEKLEILKEAGCVHVSIGLESGNYDLRKRVFNRDISDEQILNAFEIANNLGIRTSSFNMIGIPDETREDIFKTIELNKKCRAGTLNVYYLYPFQKTEIREYFEKKNLIPIQTDNLSIAEGEKFNLSKIPEEELKGLKKTFILYVNYPKEYWPVIKICESNNKFSNWLTRKMYEYMSGNIIE
jgi:anaerobic magnesium-protoporphyrin IX monomethyl ester cyclase